MQCKFKGKIIKNFKSVDHFEGRPYMTVQAYDAGPNSKLENSVESRNDNLFMGKSI